MDPGSTAQIRVNGIDLEFARQGRGTPLLVISPSWWHLAPWQVRVVDHLSRDFEVVLFNHRGVGRSQETEDGYTVGQFAADAAGLTVALGLGRVNLLGFAIGGATALLLARDFPEMVSTVTVLATGTPTPASEQPSIVRRLREEIDAQGYERYVRGHVDNDTTAFSPAFYRGNRDVALALAEALWRGQPREEVFARHASARASYELGSWVEELRVPAMIAVGGDDNAARGASTPLRAAHRLAERVPNATLQVFPGARHMLPWELPAELAAALRSFVAEHQQG